MPRLRHSNPQTDFTQSSPRTYPCYVYFISDGYEHIKIGITDDLKERLSDLQTAHHRKLEIIGIIGCVDKQSARQVETAFHLYYHSVREEREWFHITVREVKAHMQLLRTFAYSVVIKDEPSYIVKSKLKSALLAIEAVLSSDKPIHEALTSALSVASLALEENGEFEEDRLKEAS
jgi:predicted GIY-YIG superfamily endonuclease